MHRGKKKPPGWEVSVAFLLLYLVHYTASTRIRLSPKIRTRSCAMTIRLNS